MTPTRTSLLLVFLVASGCGSSEEVTKQTDTTWDFIQKYEKTFNPSDYDPALPTDVEEEKKQADEVSIPQPPPPEFETVPGFRVQVTFTDNMEQANTIRHNLTGVFADQQIYVVFEAPYYKVRVGDFTSRPDANVTLRVLFENGYKDSWIVPDKIRRSRE
jgi:hypothetical protein